jgi:hypothetical protein
MVFVMTVDQIHSRKDVDRVDDALIRLPRLLSQLDAAPVLGFERTAGDEFQGVLGDALSVVAVILDLVRDGVWHIGVGAATVEQPLPASTRAARGPAFELAREAVEAAKRSPTHVCVRGAVGPAAQDADAVVGLLAAAVARRSDPAWEAVDLVALGLTQNEVAAKLEISRQAVSQRLAAGLWAQEVAARPAAARLLTAAAGDAPVSPPMASPSTASPSTASPSYAGAQA